MFAMRSFWLLISLTIAEVSCSCNYQTATAFYQLESFKNCTGKPIGIITTTYGAPVTIKEAENSLDMELSDNINLLEQITSFNRKSIPSRVIHGKGSGAKGYFEVTHDVTDVTNAALFCEIGKITPVAARFSPEVSDRGTPDTRRGGFSMSVKFYTEEGNWDLLGLNTDVYFTKDPLFFSSFFHAAFENPQTHCTDKTSLIDIYLLRPESISFMLMIFGDPGVPGSYRHMATHAIHTFQVENYKGEMSMVRFHMLPDLGEQYLNQTEADRLSGDYPNYYTRDLYDAIAEGKYPSWTLYMQVMCEAEIETAGFDIYDVTLRWPLYKYPLRPIGKFVANKNPDNYFADVEQLAFNVGNVPPGIEAIGRLADISKIASRDAQLYRLGVNYNKIKVNCPLSQVYTYNRDGHAPVGYNYGGIPNYYPNSFNGPVPANTTRNTRKKVKPSTVPEATNLAQATEYYQCLSDGAKQRLASNFVINLRRTYPSVQQRAIEALGKVHPRLAADVTATLATDAGLPALGCSFTPDYTCPATNACPQ